MIDAVVFDLDGVLIDSEQRWDAARQGLATDHGVPWPPEATAAMQGMSSLEWSRYMSATIGVPLPAEEVNAEVVRRMLRGYHEELPALPGAAAAVERLAAHWPLGLASSSNRELIDLVLEELRVGALFRATVSSEEVPAGKPAPDVYLEAARRLGVAPDRAVAIEDSRNGIRSARAAGLAVIALPNPHYPPGDEALADAHVVVGGLDGLTVEAVIAADAARAG